MRILQNSYLEVKNSAPKQAKNLLAAHKIFIHSGRRGEVAGTAAGRIAFPESESSKIQQRKRQT